MPAASKFPEIIIGISGPIGVNVDAITTSLQTALADVKYKSKVIKITKAMENYPSSVEKTTNDDFASIMNYKIDYADLLCENHDDLAFLARIAIAAVREEREQITGNDDTPTENTAFIIRQFKRPEEVRLMRSVYGKQFILVSAYGSLEERKSILEEKQKRSASTNLLYSKYSNDINTLVERDASESHKHGGQQLRDTFHLADVFIDGITKQKMDLKLTRFMRAFFGINTAAPTKDEYGMYAAKSASLRSCDLARQIGAAIFSKDGEIITQGCNEVPKAFGGTYWDLEEPDYRDVKIGVDPNDELKREVLRNVIERLWDDDLLSKKATDVGTIQKLVDSLTAKAKNPGEKDGALVGSAITDLTEFGRVVHAEMCAICDAARLGKSLKKATLYCTTFPCHNCTKHIIAAGIDRVVYMEPYPKSKAKELHKNEIEIEKESIDKVSFVPFIGISPYRYRDIFLKENKRKDKSGVGRTWYALTDQAEPMLEPTFSTYPDLENSALTALVEKRDTPVMNDVKKSAAHEATDQSTTSPPPPFRLSQ